KSSGKAKKAPGAASVRKNLSQSDPKRKPFTPEVMDRTVIAIPLLSKLKAEREGQKEKEVYHVIIDLNLAYPGGRAGARTQTKTLLAQRSEERRVGKESRSRWSPHH